jgi:hypothetical protein
MNNETRIYILNKQWMMGKGICLSFLHRVPPDSGDLCQCTFSRIRDARAFCKKARLGNAFDP